MYTCCIKNIRMLNSVVCCDAACSAYKSSSWPLLFENSMLMSFHDYLTEGNLCHYEIIHNPFPSCLFANLSLNWVKTHTHIYVCVYVCMYIYIYIYIYPIYACLCSRKKFAHNDRNNIDTVKNVLMFMPYISFIHSHLFIFCRFLTLNRAIPVV